VPYDDYQVLLDDPATDLALGFDHYARSFEQIIRHSRAQFAIGIFGKWGSGKTTLMQAIEQGLTGREEVVPVRFSAWRYEREEHLIVPLLDTLRAALAKRAEKEDDPDTKEKARKAARTIGWAAKALLRGITLKGKLPLVAEASIDFGKMLAEQPKDADADQPNSFYAASFDAMGAALTDYLGKERRVVVFVDDLDRCLPENALEVVEAMKLFFDQEGFVFVVGLDDRGIRREIDKRYGATTTDGAKTEGGDGRDYLKKIFQVPFSLPRVSTDQIEQLFEMTLRAAGLPPAQQQDLRDNVRPHLRSMVLDAVNPREVKRFINAYTLQLKMLSANPQLQLVPAVVAAIQVMTFRDDWRQIYELLAAEPDEFQNALASALQPDATDEDFWISNEPLPADFLAYAGGPGAALTQVPLEPYVMTAELTRGSDPGLLTMRRLAAETRRLIRNITAQPITSEGMSALQRPVRELASHAKERQDAPGGPEAAKATDRLSAHVDALGAESPASNLEPWQRQAYRMLDRIDAAIAQMRSAADLSAGSGPSA
jgi:tRNA A37 threonylcarbamoyladenosine biosynthesis protein TsaE